MKRKFSLKKGCCVLLMASTVILSGCNNLSSKDYYIVIEDGKSYVCKQVGPFIKSDELHYKSVLDKKLIGSICKNKKSFDYEYHDRLYNFISEFQTVNLSDVISEEKINEEELNTFAQSKNVKKLFLGNYYKKKFYLNQKFKYNDDAELKLYKHNDDYIIGYDISPERLKNSKRYIYSITDIDTYSFASDQEVKSSDIYKYVDGNLSSDYIVYKDAEDILKNYKTKQLKKK